MEIRKMPHVKVCLGKAAWHEGWEAKAAPVEQLSIVSWALGPAALTWLNRVHAVLYCSTLVQESKKHPGTTVRSC